jgi:hypothetical protein
MSGIPNTQHPIFPHDKLRAVMPNTGSHFTTNRQYCAQSSVRPTGFSIIDNGLFNLKTDTASKKLNFTKLCRYNPPPPLTVSEFWILIQQQFYPISPMVVTKHMYERSQASAAVHLNSAVLLDVT